MPGPSSAAGAPGGAAAGLGPKTISANSLGPPPTVADLHSPDRQREREERQARRRELAEHRKLIHRLPVDELWEVPGRPQVVCAVRDYSKPNPTDGRAAARAEVPFLFKAFETGQKPPPRPGTKRAEQPRAATIHEYLDWTVTASEPEDPDELDFGGFRVVLLLPRYMMQWVPPDLDYNKEVPLKTQGLVGAPRPPIPHLAVASTHLQVQNKPIVAATIRTGPGWMEVPFYATADLRRNKGFGRALLECLEDMCRALDIPRMLLCSTDDPRTKGTWQRLGFRFTSHEEMKSAWGVTPHDLLHMDNTVQMVKDVPPRPPWRSIMLRHGDYKHRMYYLPGWQAPESERSRSTANGLKSAGVRKQPPKKPPPKKNANPAKRRRR